MTAQLEDEVPDWTPGAGNHSKSMQPGSWLIVTFPYSYSLCTTSEHIFVLTLHPRSSMQTPFVGTLHIRLVLTDANVVLATVVVIEVAPAVSPVLFACVEKASKSYALPPTKTTSAAKTKNKSPEFALLGSVNVPRWGLWSLKSVWNIVPTLASVVENAGLSPCIGFIAPPPGHFIHTLSYR